MLLLESFHWHTKITKLRCIYFQFLRYFHLKDFLLNCHCHLVSFWATEMLFTSKWDRILRGIEWSASLLWLMNDILSLSPLFIFYSEMILEFHAMSTSRTTGPMWQRRTQACIRVLNSVHKCLVLKDKIMVDNMTCLITFYWPPFFLPHWRKKAEKVGAQLCQS